MLVRAVNHGWPRRQDNRAPQGTRGAGAAAAQVGDKGHDGDPPGCGRGESARAEGTRAAAVRAQSKAGGTGDESGAANTAQPRPTPGLLQTPANPHPRAVPAPSPHGILSQPPNSHMSKIRLLFFLLCLKKPYLIQIFTI